MLLFDLENLEPENRTNICLAISSDDSQWRTQDSTNVEARWKKRSCDVRVNDASDDAASFRGT